VPSVKAGDLSITSKNDITRDVTEVGKATTLTIKYTMQNDIQNGFFYVQFPPDTFYQAGITCKFIYGTTTVDAPTTCTLTPKTGLLGSEADTVRISMQCGATCLKTDSYEVQITGLLNRYTTEPASGVMTIAT
jgi:hypothetical protein